MPDKIYCLTLGLPLGSLAGKTRIRDQNLSESGYVLVSDPELSFGGVESGIPISLEFRILIWFFGIISGSGSGFLGGRIWISIFPEVRIRF